MTDFGAFVELAPGVDALLHVSQISREHVAKPADVLSIGQEIEAKVVDFNGEDKKISLSMKALEAPAELRKLQKNNFFIQNCSEIDKHHLCIIRFMPRWCFCFGKIILMCSANREVYVPDIVSASTDHSEKYRSM